MDSNSQVDMQVNFLLFSLEDFIFLDTEFSSFAFHFVYT